MTREQFEAWARPLWRHREDFDQLIGAAPGTYNNYEVQAAWVAWQESARLKQEACAALVEQLSARPRAIRAALNGTQPEPCEYAAAIRAMRGDGMSINYTAEGGEEYDAGLGTTPGMWECLREHLAEAHIFLPESLNEAIYALCEGRAKAVTKGVG